MWNLTWHAFTWLHTSGFLSSPPALNWNRVIFGMNLAPSALQRVLWPADFSRGPPVAFTYSMSLKETCSNEEETQNEHKVTQKDYKSHYTVTITTLRSMQLQQQRGLR